MSGTLYPGGAAMLKMGFLWYAWCLLRSDGVMLLTQTFAYSEIYLTVLFAFLMVDRYFMALTT